MRSGKRWWGVWWLGACCFTQLLGQDYPTDPPGVVQAYWTTYQKAVRQNDYLAFTPPVVALANGMTSLDTASYFQKLRQSPFLTARFLDHERQRLQPCLDTLGVLPYREYLKNDEAESYFFHCPFFMVFPLFFGPQFFEPTTVTTTVLSQSPSQATVKITLGHSTHTQATYFDLLWETSRWKIIRGYY